MLSGVLALMAISVWGWRIVSGRLARWELDVSKWLLWPTMLVMLLSQISQHEIFAAGWQNLAGVWRYPLRGHCSGVMLRRCRRASPDWRTFHSSG